MTQKSALINVTVTPAVILVPRWSISAAPVTQEVKEGENANASCTIEFFDGWDVPITLSVVEAPTVVFPNPVMAGTYDFTIPAEFLPLGDNRFHVNGDDGL